MKSRRKDPRIRLAITQEAARLMYEEEVRQYFTAKRMAAKRLFSKRGAHQLRFRPRDLPSNGEIQAALLKLADLEEGSDRRARQTEMRKLALLAMRELAEFHPRLIGSVATGHVHRRSDIDIQLFCEDEDAPEQFIQARGWSFERQDVLVRRKKQGLVKYQHLLLDADYPIELSIYDLRDLRKRPKSSTDGKPMVRLSIRDLETLISEESLNSKELKNHNSDLNKADL
ncbi:MAG: hypothetical protein GY854_05850 [Deltaproteobacteria bacterium]|nr:hypothetical protein [Deltaproteobacteria bacterium]